MFDRDEIQRIVNLGERKAKTWEIELLHKLKNDNKICICKVKKYFTYAKEWLKNN